MDDDPIARPTPAELVEGSLARVEMIQEAPSDPPGNEWNFALGVLFALSTTGQLDRDAAVQFDDRIRAEANRLWDLARAPRS